MTLARRVRTLHRWLVPPKSGQGWTAYLWLAYLCFFFIEWIFRPVGPLELALGLLTVTGFVVLYFSAYRRRGLAALRHILVMVALAGAWSPYNAGSSVLFIYGAAFAHQVGRPRHSILVVIGIAALAATIALWAKPQPFYWIPGVFISIIVGLANIYFSEQHRQNAELRLSQAETRRLARVAERERIARDLHDLLGHTLSMITVKSELAGKLIGADPKSARREIGAIEQTARQALSDVRKAISGFHEQTLDQALEHARLSLISADIELEVVREAGDRLTLQTEAMLSLVIREAVTNIIRHSDARHARIVLSADGGRGLKLKIEDDGRGRIRPDGSGIQGMRARIESLGGWLEIGNGRGGRLVAHVPEMQA